MKKRIVIALGGNALQSNPKDISAQAQYETIKYTAKPIVDLIEAGHQVIIVHGNGPQVGQIMAAYEENDDIPNMPFPESGAMTQGYIGYHLQQVIGDEIAKRQIKKQISTIITQVIIDKNDQAFQNPTKPVGSFYSEEEARKLEKEMGYIMKEDSGRGYRRVVPSPKPEAIVEAEVLKTMVENDYIVITAGGGGIPVIKNEDNSLEGVAAVIDKDSAAALVAEIVDADMLIVLTAVEKVFINFNTPDAKALDTISVEEAYKYIEEGHFPKGSMFEKVEAGINFVKSKKNGETLITSLEKAKEGIEGKTGTRIIL